MAKKSKATLRTVQIQVTLWGGVEEDIELGHTETVMDIPESKQLEGGQQPMTHFVTRHSVVELMRMLHNLRAAM